MSYLSLQSHIPQKYSSSRRKYIMKKLNHLEKLRKNMNIACGSCEIDPSTFKDNRTHLMTALRHRFPNSIVLLKGNYDTPPRYCAGHCFEQNSDFYWAFGVLEPNFWGGIDLVTGVSYLFYKSSIVKNKIVHSGTDPASIAKRYKVDRVMSSMEMKAEISLLNRKIVLVLQEMDERAFEELKSDRVYIALADCHVWLCNKFLSPIMRDIRVVKSEKEEMIMRFAARLNNEGVHFVLHHLHFGMTGYCAVALFNLYMKYSQNSATPARPPICLSGTNALCTIPESAQSFLNEDLNSGDLCVLDMGVAVHGYRTNVVLTAPVSGEFSTLQEVIYNIALDVEKAMLKSLKPGTKFSQLEAIAHKKLVDLLCWNNMLDGDTDLILKSGIQRVFCPNGIGHFLGIDFYDGESDHTPNSSGRRRNYFYRQIMKPGMMIALNSELYMNEAAIKSHADANGGEYLMLESLEKYFGLVVRIQDTVLITADSYEMLSSVPRSIREITSFMKEKKKLMVRLFEEPPTGEKLGGLVLTSMRSARAESIEKPAKGFECIKNISAMSLDYMKDRILKNITVEEIMEKLTELRKPRSNKLTNQLIDDVYNYPCKFDNLLEVLLVPILPERRRPQLLPYPKANLPTSEVTFPPDGFGCPHFGWIENITSCDEIEDYCAELSSTSITPIIK